MNKGGDEKSHSWWRDSHISPKNSKWLEENLEGMDKHVKTMLKLIEEDADSFAKKAEMYYKKRPELVNHVEEFYRMYRSLAERYDQLTGELRKNIPSNLKKHYGLDDDSLPDSQHSTENKRRPAGFDFFLGSRNSDCSKKGDGSSDDRASISSSDEESEKSSKPHLDLQILKEENERYRTEFDKVQEDYYVLQQKTRVLQEGILHLKEENEILRNEAAGKSDYMVNLQEQIAGLQTRNTELESQIRSMAVQVEQSGRSNAILHKHDDQLAVGFQGPGKMARELEMEIENLQKKLHSSQEENDALKFEFQRCQQDYEMAGSRIKELKTDTSAQEMQIHKLEVEIDNMKHKLSEMHEENNVLSVQNETGNQKLCHAESEIKHLQEENESLIKENSIKILNLNDLEVLNSSLIKEKDQLESELLLKASILGGIEENLNNLKEKNQMLSGKLDASTQEQNVQIETMKESIFGLQDQNKTLSDQLLESRKRNSVLETRLSEVEEENRRLQSEIENLRAVLQKGEYEANALMTEKAALENDIISSKEKLHVLKSKCHFFNDNAELTLLDTEPMQQKTFHEHVLELEQFILHIKEEHDHLKIKFHNEVEEGQNFKAELEKLRNELVSFSAENNLLQLEISSKEELLKKLDGDDGYLREENIMLKKDITDSIDHVQKLEEECRELKINIQRMAQVKEEEELMLHNTVQTLQQDNERLKDELQNTCKENDDLGKKISLIKEELLQLQEKNTDLKEQVASSQVENEQLQNQVSVKVDTIQNLEKLVSSLEQEKINLDSEVGSLTNQIQNLLLLLNTLKDFKEKTTEALVIDQKHVQQLEITVQELKELNYSLTLDKTTLEAKYQDISEQLEACQQMLKRLQEENSEVTDQRNSLVSELASKSACISNLEEELLHLEQENSAKVGRFDDDVQKLQEALSSLKTENMKMKAEYENVVEDYCSLQDRVKDLGEQKIALEQENVVLQSDVESLTSQIQNLQSLVCDLNKCRDQFQLLEEKNNLESELLDKLGGLEDDVRKLQEAYGSIKAESINFKAERQPLMEDHLSELKKVKDLQMEKLTLEEKCQHLLEDLGTIKDRLNLLQKQLSGLEQNSLINNDASETVTVVQQLKEDIVMLGNNKSSLQTEMPSKMDVLGDLKEELSYVLSETTDLKVEVQLKAEQILELELEIERLRKDMVNLDKKNKLLLDESFKQIDEKKELLQDVYRLQKENDDLQQEALARMQSMKTLESTIARLQEDNKGLETQVKWGTEEILGLRKHMEDLHLEHASLINASQIDGRKIEELQLKVVMVEKEVQELREESEMQRSIIFDRAEEKREAIRQLCFSIDHFKHNYKHLQQVLSTLLQNHNRTAAS